MKLKVLKCPECGANLEIEEGPAFCFCKFCGCKIMLDEEKQEIIFNKNVNINQNIHKRFTDDAAIVQAELEEKMHARDNKTRLISMLLLFTILIILSVSLLLINVIPKSQGKIKAGNYKELVGQDYKMVKAHFEAAGFKNIEVIDLKDSGLSFWTNNKVVKISVGGDTDFTSDNWFNKETKVVISHH